MENLRVYEAARKLNLETSELMARLAQRGVTVTGPIDTVTEADIDAVAEELRGASPDAAPPVAEEAPVAPAPILRLAPREETKETPPDEPAPEEPTREEAAGAKAAHQGRTPHVAPAPHLHAKPSKAPTAMAAAALGLAALALLAGIGLYTSVKEHATRIATLTDQTSTLAATAQDAALNAETALAMGINNANHLARVDRRITLAEQARIGGELARRSAALEEMAPTLPVAHGEKVAELARRLGALARSL